MFSNSSRTVVFLESVHAFQTHVQLLEGVAIAKIAATTAIAANHNLDTIASVVQDLVSFDCCKEPPNRCQRLGWEWRNWLKFTKSGSGRRRGQSSLERAADRRSARERHALPGAASADLRHSAVFVANPIFKRAGEISAHLGMFFVCLSIHNKLASIVITASVEHREAFVVPFFFLRRLFFSSSSSSVDPSLR